MLKAIELGSPTPSKTPLPQGSEVGDGAVKKRRKHTYLVLHQCPSNPKLLEGSFIEGGRMLEKYVNGELNIEDVVIDENLIGYVAKVIACSVGSKVVENPFGVKMLIIKYDEEKYDELIRE
jgi:hypothetical protein